MKIQINDVISNYYGISESKIFEQLQGATPGEEIEIIINSPGGDVYSGIAIFNHIREAAKTHKVTVRINGIAASMASYIAVAARTVNKDSKIIISENSVFLVHNPWQIVMGDYREMSKSANYLERLAAMSGSTYAHVSGKTEKETRNLMDAETYFVGNEIIENGFANEFEQINKKDDETYAYELDKNALIINAKLQIEKCSQMLRATARADLEKAVALISTVYNPSTYAEAPAISEGSLEPAPGPAGGGVLLENSNQNGGANMDKEKLKKEYPELYAAIYGEGKEAGVKEERERVEAHLKLGEENNAMKIAAQFIRGGNQLVENKVQAEYLSAMKTAAALESRNADNPPPVNPANGQGADDAAMEAAWNHGIAGKNEKGAKHE